MTDIEDRRTAAMDRQTEAVTTPAPLYVQACPGAGKTRVIVQRHLRGESPSPRRGRAIVSFTNVASNEVMKRCGDAARTDLLAFPNFVGTIDTFHWRYLARPFLPPGRLWQRIDSWDRVNAKVTVHGAREYRLRLSDFRFRRNGDDSPTQAHLQPTANNVKVYRALSSEGLLEAAEQAALTARKEFTDRGYVTGDEVRILASHALERHGAKVVDVILTRFNEVIIDEAQDCSDLDLAILARLSDGGVPFVFVCDPDQAIYEFRGARPEKVREFGATLGARIDLTGNWRSSSAICKVAASLRPARFARPADDPIGPYHDEPTGIMLLPVQDLDHAVEAFTIRADAMGIAADSRLALAHASTKLPKQAASVSQSPDSATSTRVAWAASVLSSPHANPRQRDHAYEILERCILNYWYSNTDGQTINDLCDRLHVDRRQLRSTTSRFAAALPNVDEGTFRDWCTNVNALLKLHRPSPDIERLDKSGTLRATSSTSTGSAREAGGVPLARTAQPLKASVIHQVKGEETDAVLLIVPDDRRADDLVNAWISGEHNDDVAESLRVL